jgi:hypothetical protein
VDAVGGGLTPEAAQPVRDEAPPGPPPQHQQPKGRILIFWGCGEHACPGQPYTIDFADMGANSQAGQQYAGLMRNIAINPMQPPWPSPSRNASRNSSGRARGWGRSCKGSAASSPRAAATHRAGRAP